MKRKARQMITDERLKMGQPHRSIVKSGTTQFYDFFRKFAAAD